MRVSARWCVTRRREGLGVIGRRGVDVSLGLNRLGDPRPVQSYEPVPTPPLSTPAPRARNKRSNKSTWAVARSRKKWHQDIANRRRDAMNPTATRDNTVADIPFEWSASFSIRED